VLKGFLAVDAKNPERGNNDFCTSEVMQIRLGLPENAEHTPAGSSGTRW
jgi:hypothetical protein